MILENVLISAREISYTYVASVKQKLDAYV